MRWGLLGRSDRTLREAAPVVARVVTVPFRFAVCSSLSLVVRLLTGRRPFLAAIQSYNY